MLLDDNEQYISINLFKRDLISSVNQNVAFLLSNLGLELVSKCDDGFVHREKGFYSFNVVHIHFPH